MCENGKNEGTLGDVRERGLIDIIRSIARSAGVDGPGIYPGDDACILQLDGMLLALSSDVIWADTH
ncbi:MAG: hypothetical protein KAT70_07990, partial [Thermoplasmata archaeon]|nr:hypothetical protein [Thermoplasmata archaeon]